MATKIINILITLTLLASIEAHTHKKTVSKRCTHELENINLVPGQQARSKIRCSIYSCIKNGTSATLKIKRCILRPLHPGCYYSEENLQKPFPHCCPKMICDPQHREDFVRRYELDYMTKIDDDEFQLTDFEDYSGVIESYEIHQRGASECIDESGKIAMLAGQHYEDKRQCMYYSCIPAGNSLRLRVASCFHETPGRGCYRTPMDLSKSFPRCCPVTHCDSGNKNVHKKPEGNPKPPQKCYIWNQHLTLSEGAQVQINGGCGLYTCMAQGKLQMSGCMKTTLPPGCKYSKPNLGKPFPQCCRTIVCPRKIQEKVTEHREKCVVKHENLFLTLGQRVKSKSKCMLYTCLGCGKIKTSSCEVKPLSSGCRYSSADLRKPFPECCPQIICETRTQQQVVKQLNATDTYKPGNTHVEESDKDYQNTHKSIGQNQYINKTTGRCSVIQANKELQEEGICGRYFCIQNGNDQRIVFSRCSAKPAQPHCEYYKGDTNEVFPRCCPMTVCRNMEVQTGQHVILGSNEHNTELNLYYNKSGSGNKAIYSNTCSYPSENIKLIVGQHLSIPGKCAQYFCKLHGTSPRLEISSCFKKPLPSGCHYTQEDYMKQFPECCPIVICMTQQRKDANQQNQFPFHFRPEQSLIKESDINIDVSGSSTIHTDDVAHFHITGIGSKTCYSPKDNMRVQVGSVVKAKGQCAQYSCVLDGGRIQLKFSSCSKKQVPSGCYKVNSDLSKPFPYCCPVIKCEKHTVVPPTKCYHPEKNIILAEGQVENLKSSCEQYSCIRVGNKLQLRGKSCDTTSPPPPGCHYTKADKTKPFPGCCSAMECHVTSHGRRNHGLLDEIGQPDPQNGVFNTNGHHPTISLENKLRERRQVNVVAETSGKCYVWKENVKLPVGEEIKSKGQCILYSCISEGDKTLLKTYSCTFNPLRPGCSYSAQDLTRPFPDCCPVMSCHKNETQTIETPNSSTEETPGKCYHPEGNRPLLPGSVAYGAKKCERYSCALYGNTYKLKTESCIPKVYSPECTYKDGDLSKRYPDCCPVKECVHLS